MRSFDSSGKGSFIAFETAFCFNHGEKKYFAPFCHCPFPFRFEQLNLERVTGKYENS